MKRKHNEREHFIREHILEDIRNLKREIIKKRKLLKLHNCGE